MKSINLSGARIGRWTVQTAISGTRTTGRRWICVCDCSTVKEVDGRTLRSGNSLSCGCLRAEKNTKHGHNKKPGGVRVRSKAYSRWSAMVQRCGNPNHRAYENYGGRGIAVCDKWMDFRAFLADMGEPPEGATLDRIDNNGNYEPENCRWASRKDQQRNRRTNRLFTIGTETRCLSEWADLSGVNLSTVRYRLRAGMNLQQALTVA